MLSVLLARAIFCIKYYCKSNIYVGVLAKMKAGNTLFCRNNNLKRKLKNIKQKNKLTKKNFNKMILQSFLGSSVFLFFDLCMVVKFTLNAASKRLA